jgi:hypothetical protein
MAVVFRHLTDGKNSEGFYHRLKGPRKLEPMDIIGGNFHLFSWIIRINVSWYRVERALLEGIKPRE